MTKIASYFLGGVLLLASLSIANAESCEILLPAPTQAGSILLVPGQYRVSLDGTDAVFQNVRNSRSFRVAVKVEENGVTYDSTRISTSKGAGSERMNTIEFEGSGTKIEFR